MIRILIPAPWVFLTPQSDPARQARELVEKLMEGKIEGREEAARVRAAIPELEKAVKYKDPEVVERAAGRVRVFGIAEKRVPPDRPTRGSRPRPGPRLNLIAPAELP
jgi:hypothetical protein